MKIRDIVSFSKENFYNGAVQTEWFYEVEKRSAVAESYVFHGPKYYGVSQKDVNTDKHKLIDTASFVKKLTDKLYSSKPDNCFVMNIAGYGTGKSHLAVCLGALFSEDVSTRRTITANIAAADSEIGAYILQRNTARNLVIVLNGMNNFNLDAEMLRCIRLSLQLAGISDEYLQRLTRSYDIARRFVEKMYEFCQNQFVNAAKKHGITIAPMALKKYLLTRIETDSHVLQVINDVYEEMNGDKIAWDRGLSAGDILLATQAELCGEGKPFNKILILFDELGRYFEYTAANPTVAGEAALQQIFEAIQNSDGKIIFAGFLQYELEVYLRVMEKTSNSARFVGRYNTASEKLYLSSNFETILANILKKREPSFSRVVGTAVGKYERFHSKMQSALIRWDRSANKKGVWTSQELYNTVILKGCYPLHPITVWLLSGSHVWMQQRSTLAFTSEMFENVADEELEGTWLPYIYPAQVIDSSIFNEMLNSEEKGLVSSQYCMLYRDIISKIDDKLSALEKTVLKAILVINMGHMAFLDKADAMKAIQYCSGLKEDQIGHAIKMLEEAHGVIAFDESAKTFDFLAEASGFNEFQRLYIRYQLGQTARIDDLDQETRDQLKLGSVIETSFGQEKHISSTEWCFAQRLHASTDITELYLQNLIREVSTNTDGEKPRGMLIYAYCAHDADGECKRIAALHSKLDLIKYPILILFVDDPDGDILTGIKVKKILSKFSEKDQIRFKKHIDDQNRKQSRKIISRFNQSVTKREMITANGRTTYAGRVNTLCSQCFSALYTKPIPFVFDGFENKNKIQAKSALISLCVSLLNRTITNPQVYSSLPQKEKNRITFALSTKQTDSWRVFTDNCQLIAPLNPIVSEILAEIVCALESGERITVNVLFQKYLIPPYGMNIISMSLFISYFIALQGNKYYYYFDKERLSEQHWMDSKTGKYKLLAVDKISIQKNLHADVDAVAELCARIMANTQIEQCAQYRTRLQELVAQEGETDSNRHKVAEAMAYLEVGFRMVKATREKQEKAQKAILEVSRKFNIPQAVRTLEMIPVITPYIEEGYLYEYSDAYKAAVKVLHRDLDNLMDRYLMQTVPKITCKITELSQLQSIYSRVIKMLREYDYCTYADAIEARIAAVEKDLLAKQRHEQVLIELERDLALSGSATKYQECGELIIKLTNWKEYFEGIDDLPADIAASIFGRINTTILALRKRREDLLASIASLRSKVKMANTLIDLKGSEQQLENLSKMGLEEDQIREIVAFREAVREAIDEIERLPNDLDMLTKYISRISERTNPFCWMAIKACAMTKKSQLEKEQQKWIREVLMPAELNYAKMTSKDCERWLRQIENLPEYLSASIYKRVDNAKMLIEGQLHHSRVEQLLAMYNKLSEGEKQTFKKLLNDQ